MCNGVFIPGVTSVGGVKRLTSPVPLSTVVKSNEESLCWHTKVSSTSTVWYRCVGNGHVGYVSRTVSRETPTSMSRHIGRWKNDTTTAGLVSPNVRASNRRTGYTGYRKDVADLRRHPLPHPTPPQHQIHREGRRQRQSPQQRPHPMRASISPTRTDTMWRSWGTHDGGGQGPHCYTNQRAKP